MIDRTKSSDDGNSYRPQQPDMERINRVVLKNARGHAYFEYGEPKMEAPLWVWARPLESMSGSERAEFEGLAVAGGLAAWPEVGNRMMTRIAAGLDMDGDWIVVQDGAYRYSVDDADGLRVRSVVWEYLATEVRGSPEDLAIAERRTFKAIIASIFRRRRALEGYRGDVVVVIARRTARDSNSTKDEWSLLVSTNTPPQLN